MHIFKSTAFYFKFKQTYRKIYVFIFEHSMF